MRASQTPPPFPQPPGSAGSGHQPQSRPRPLIPTWIWWLVLVSLLAWNSSALFGPKGARHVTLSYTDSLEQVRAGTVATVTIHGQDVSGTFT